MGKGVERDWPPDEELVAHCKRHPTMAAASRALAPPATDATLRKRLERIGRLDEVRQHHRRGGLTVVAEPEQDPIAEQIRSRLKGKAAPTVEQLADDLDVAPRRIRDSLAKLRHDGYRIPEEDEAGRVGIERVPPVKDTLHRSLLEGTELRVGVVSDTHFGSKEEASEHLHLSYDHFQSEGITEVWHTGDLVAGMGIYRGQANDLKLHTYEDQVAYTVENYPRRDGITTRMIAGNHDLEGDFGRIGADPVQAVANQRDDLDYLGPWEAWLELPGGSFVHLLHAKGGMSYAFSYKAQKLVDGYPAGRKPAVLIVGHYHVRGDFQARGVQVLFPGCYEWRTTLGKRLGLTPAVGHHIVNITVGDDGFVCGWKPEWYPYAEARVVADGRAAA